MENVPDSFYRYHVFVCLNERSPGHALGCCSSKGAERIFGYLKTRIKELGLSSVRINRAGCLDRCSHGPLVVIYPQAIWYRITDKQMAEIIIQQHLIAGKVVPEFAV